MIRFDGSAPIDTSRRPPAVRRWWSTRLSKCRTVVDRDRPECRSAPVRRRRGCRSRGDLGGAAVVDARGAEAAASDCWLQSRLVRARTHCRRREPGSGSTATAPARGEQCQSEDHRREFRKSVHGGARRQSRCRESAQRAAVRSVTILGVRKISSSVLSSMRARGLEEVAEVGDVAQQRHLGDVVALGLLEDAADDDRAAVLDQHLGLDVLGVDREAGRGRAGRRCPC